MYRKTSLRSTRYPPNPDAAILHGFDIPNSTIFGKIDSVQTARPRLHREKRRVAVSFGELVNHLRQREVSQTVAIVGEENFFAIQMWLYKPQTVYNLNVTQCR